jgi:hypothetical protein
MRGREIVEKKFSWRQVIKQYESIWDGLLAVGKEALANSTDATSMQTDFSLYLASDFFDHYATTSTNYATCFLITVRGSDQEICSLLLEMASDPSEWFDKSILELILRRAQSGKPISVSAISSELSTVEMERMLYPLKRETILFAHLMRLVKYGLLSISVSP